MSKKSDSGGYGCLILILFLMFINGCFRGCGYAKAQSVLVVTEETSLPTNHFSWMPKLDRDDFNNPEWNFIRFGNNPVNWITFRRGSYGNYWNGWEPNAATERNAVILQSLYEPVAVKTNGVWIITFKRETK